VKRLACFLLFSGVVLAQVAADANKDYQTKEGREGIARHLADANRDVTQKPRDIIDALALKPGNVVADVGTGVGFMLPYMSRAVGEKGQVIAEDISNDFLDKAKSRVQLLNYKNVKFVLGNEHDPKLPADTVDAVLVLDVYHHFDYPEDMLGHIHDSLLSDGRLVIVDFYKRPDAMPGGRAMQHIRLDEDDVIKEVEANGFRLSSKRELVPKAQYLVVFVKK